MPANTKQAFPSTSTHGPTMDVPLRANKQHFGYDAFREVGSQFNTNHNTHYAAQLEELDYLTGSVQTRATRPDGKRDYSTFVSIAHNPDFSSDTDSYRSRTLE